MFSKTIIDFDLYRLLRIFAHSGEGMGELFRTNGWEENQIGRLKMSDGESLMIGTLNQDCSTSRTRFDFVACGHDIFIFVN